MSKNFILLDGGMGREIKARLNSFDPLLWSASAFLTQPEIIVDIHREFIQSGANVITTNNYTVVPSILNQTGYCEQFESLTIQSGHLAQRAKSLTPSVKVAGCIPPLKSSYRPDFVLSQSEGVPIYQRIKTWLEPNVELFLCESMTFM